MSATSCTHTQDGAPEPRRCENQPTWKPLEFPSLTAAIVLLLGGPSGREGQRDSEPSADICLRDFPSCCLETEASPSVAEVNGLETNCFTGTTVVTGWKAGKRAGSEPSPGLCPWGTPQRNLGASSTLCLLRGFLTEAAEETAL